MAGPVRPQRQLGGALLGHRSTIRIGGTLALASLVLALLLLLGTAETRAQLTASSGLTSVREGGHHDSATAAGRGVVITPKPGQRIGKHPVRIVVRAGLEHGDLRARLNGVKVGEEFARASRGRRVLKASNSHGLKHGRNKLRVVAERNGTVRRRTVRFRVTHRRPMAGAGLDLRVPVAGRAHLEGEVARRRKGGHRPRPMRWRVVKAPKQAQISSGTRARRAAALKRALQSPGTATPTFRPEVLGRYVLEFEVGSGAKATTDRVAVDAVPAVGQLEVDTAVEHGGGVFGIKVGDRDYQAPPMHQDGTSVSWVGSSATWSHYAALWQVLVLERKTLQVDSNTTYGYCQGAPGQGICQKGDNGEPFLVIDPAGKAAQGSAAALRQQLLNLGPKYVVVAANHYDNDLAWGNFDTGSIATGALSAIGFPSKPSQGLAEGGSAAAIGVPGVEPGEGDFQIPGTAQRMRGYLTPDTLDHFDFIPLARQPFDTRVSGSCTASECSWAMSVGGQEQLWPGSPGPAPRTITGKVANGEAGYLVAALDGHDLSLIGSEVFVTEGDTGDFNGAAEKMTAFLQKANAAGSVIMVSSIHTPGQSRAVLANSSIEDNAWVELAKAVADAGGTRHDFNVAAHDFSRDYSLVGRGGIGEGEGVETASGGGAQIRGALAPDNASLFGPVNTSTDPGAAGAPADRLNQLLLMPPSKAWTPMSSPGAWDALRALGCNVGLTEDPRAKYAELDAKLANQKHSAVNDANFDGVKGDAPCNTGLTYNLDEFTEAQGQLRQELLWVGNVRIYFDYLAYPYDNVSANAAVETQHLADYLEAELDAYDKEAELGFDPLGFLVALLNIAGAAIGDPELGQQVKVMSGVVQMAKQFASTDYSGRAPDIDNQPRIQADELADRLKEDADSTIQSYERMGDMIVSDPAKLEEVGLRADCLKPCVPNQPVFDEYAMPNVEEAKRVANLGLERTIYEHLLPVSFPVYDLGLTTNPTPQNLDCDGPATPFEDFLGASAPRRSWEPSLDEFHPSGSPSRWRVQIMVHRDNETYSWPDQTLLDRMFNAVDVDAVFPSTPPPSEDEGDPLPGLAIDRVDLLREATSRFVPSSSEPCSWGPGGVPLDLAQQGN